MACGCGAGVFFGWTRSWQWIAGDVIRDVREENVDATRGGGIGARRGGTQEEERKRRAGWNA